MTAGGPRRLLALGAVLTVAGLIIAATAPVAGTAGSERTPVQTTVGGIVVVAGWLVLGWGIHKFGRESTG